MTAKIIELIKVVPNTEPNADGEWIHLPEPVNVSGMKWADYTKVFSDHIPDGYHLVMVASRSDD